MLNWLFGTPKQPSPRVLHKAEEYGQARELTAKEVLACLVMSVAKGVTAGAGLGLIYIILCLFTELEWSILVTAGVVAITTITIACAQAWLDLDEMRDGLRSYRSAETYAPPMPGEAPQLPAPDITVRPYKGDPYLIGRGGGPGETVPALPAPAQQRAITEPVVAAALQAAIENDGTWSRRTITAVRLRDGRKITRGMWKKLTHTLQGILVLQPDGSHRLPADVTTFEDVVKYVPSLAPTQATGPKKDVPPACPPAHLPTCPPAQAPKRQLFGTWSEKARQLREHDG